MAAPKKILVLRFSSIGDIVLTTPVLRGLKEQLGAEVHYATKPGFRGILETNPRVDKLHTLDGSIWQLIKALRKERFDHVVDLHNNLRTRLIKLFLLKPSTTFRKLNWQKWLLVRFKINKLPRVHVVDRYLVTVQKLGVKPDDLGLEYYLNPTDEVEPDWLPTTYRKDFVAVVVGAKHATKRLPVERLIELCDRINRPIVLLGGPEDAPVGEEIERFFTIDQSKPGDEETLERELNKKARVFNGCGKFSLGQSASLVQQSNYVFTHDTGLMHIAAAFGKTIFSTWGNTVLDFGMYPYRTKFTVFEKQGLSCRPCSKIGYNACPKGHFKCMNEVVFDFFLP